MTPQPDTMRTECPPCTSSRLSLARMLDEPGLQAADWVVLVFCALLALVVLIHWSAMIEPVSCLGVLMAISVSTLLFSRIPLRTPHFSLISLARWILPAPIIPLIFCQLPQILPATGIKDADLALVHIDQWLFGCQPSIWIAPYVHPIVVEVLFLPYVSFYFIHVAVGVYLYCKKRYARVDYFCFLMLWGFFLSYLGYFLVPAVGPRFVLAHQYPGTLHGLGFYEPMNQILNTLEGAHRDCFPSGHTMMTLVSLTIAWYRARPLFYWLAPIGMGVLLATIALRFHYGVDILGGILWYAMAMVSAPIVYRRLVRFCRPSRRMYTERTKTQG